MGGKKKKKKPWIYKFTRQIENRPPVDISPFVSSVQGKIGEHVQTTTQNIEQLQSQRLQLLQNALLNAVGSLQYNPYAERTKQAYQQVLQQKIEPLKETETQAISQYSAITPDVSKALRMTGAYQWAQKNPTSSKAKDIIKYYGEAYESGMQFIDQTRGFLKDLGFEDNEIEEAIKPYTSLIEEGYRML